MAIKIRLNIKESKRKRWKINLLNAIIRQRAEFVKFLRDSFHF